MGHIPKGLLKDCSTRDAFVFALACTECGRVWNSTPIPFSGKSDSLYRQEKEAALIRAADEAAEVFNYCPGCSCPVCDYCFLVCDDTDLCASCAKKLHTVGEPVMQYA